jgi:hypothetical protein
MKVPRDFAHLGAVDGEEAVGEDVGRRAVAGVFQFGGPEQGMEIEDVFADEMVQLGLGTLAPELVEIEPFLPHKFLKEPM